MNLLNRMKHYNFWVALSMAFIVLLNTLSDGFGFKLDDALVNDIIMAILGVLVVLGFVQKDGYDFVDTNKKDSPNLDNVDSVFESKEENAQIDEDITQSIVDFDEQEAFVDDKPSKTKRENAKKTTIEVSQISDEDEVDIDKIINDLKLDLNKNK